MKNGSAAYLYRAVNGSLIKAASYTETSDAYEFYVNGTYYSEALDLFGVDESNGVKAATVLNCY